MTDRRLTVWNPANAQGQAQRNDGRIHYLQQCLTAYDQDRQCLERRAQHRCRACFYVYRRIGGDALTPFHCAHCGQDAVSATTAIPKLCLRCAQMHSWCQECGAAMD